MPSSEGAQAVRHPLFARYFDRFAARDEERGQAALRQELLAGLAGQVVELGAGNGLNFGHYPATVTRVVALEPEAYLRERAVEAARKAPVDIRVVGGVAGQLPAADGSFDAAVVSGVLCSVIDAPAALAEVRRVLRAGGELRFYEHVRAAGMRGRSQDLADLVWPRMMGGCHPNRDTRTVIEGAGYEIMACRSLMFPATARFSPVAPRILGVARPPA